MVTCLYQYKLPIGSTVREGLILQIGDHFGEIAPLPGRSSETLQEAREEIFHWMRTKEDPRLPSVRWGIECAKHPLRSVHLPLCALGPKEGFTTAKLKLGHLSPEEAIPFVQKHIGRFDLRLDCNHAWTLDQALTFAACFKPSDFTYIEEPVDCFEDLVRFSEITQFPIAVDESIDCNWMAIPSLKAVIIKPTLTGGIPQVPPHLDLILSSSYESGLGLLHIANRAQNSLPIGLDTYCVLQNDLLTTPIDCSSGFFSWKASAVPLLNWSKLCAL